MDATDLRDLITRKLNEKKKVEKNISLLSLYNDVDFIDATKHEEPLKKEETHREKQEIKPESTKTREIRSLSGTPSREKPTDGTRYSSQRTLATPDASRTPSQPTVEDEVCHRTLSTSTQNPLIQNTRSQPANEDAKPKEKSLTTAIIDRLRLFKTPKRVFSLYEDKVQLATTNNDTRSVVAENTFKTSPRTLKAVFRETPEYLRGFIERDSSHRILSIFSGIITLLFRLFITSVLVFFILLCIHTVYKDVCVIRKTHVNEIRVRREVAQANYQSNRCGPDSPPAMRAQCVKWENEMALLDSDVTLSAVFVELMCRCLREFAEGFTLKTYVFSVMIMVFAYFCMRR